VADSVVLKKVVIPAAGLGTKLLSVTKGAHETPRHPLPTLIWIPNIPTPFRTSSSVSYRNQELHQKTLSMHAECLGSLRRDGVTGRDCLFLSVTVWACVLEGVEVEDELVGMVDSAF